MSTISPSLARGGVPPPPCPPHIPTHFPLPFSTYLPPLPSSLYCTPPSPPPTPFPTRRAALVALTVRCAEPLAKLLTEEFYAENQTLSTRMETLAGSPVP